MRHILIFITLSLLPLRSYSQTFIALSSGLTIPLGSFANNDWLNNDSGYAKTGSALDLSVGTMVLKKVGLFSTLKAQFNSHAAANAFTVGGDSYKSITLFIGPYYRFCIGKSFYLDLKLATGFLYSHYPKETQGNDLLWAYTRGKPAGSIAFLSGICLRKKISSIFDMSLAVDYVTAKPSFSVTGETYDHNDLVYSSTSTIRQNMSTLNALVGLTYRLNK